MKWLDSTNQYTLVVRPAGHSYKFNFLPPWQTRRLPNNNNNNSTLVLLCKHICSSFEFIILVLLVVINFITHPKESHPQDSLGNSENEIGSASENSQDFFSSPDLHLELL